MVLGDSHGPRLEPPADANRPLVIAHRGASHEAPENTLPAFQLAFDRHQADGIELDVRLTRDGKLAVLHDKDTARTGDRSLAARQSTLAQLQTVQVGTHDGVAQRVPELHEVLKLVPEGKYVYVEMKPDFEGDRALAHAVAKELVPGDPRVVVHSFDQKTLAAFHEKAPSFPTGLLFHTNDTGVSQAADAVHAQALHPQLGALDAGMPSAYGNRPVAVWTVDEPADIQRVAQLGVKAIITNEPGAAREALGLDTAPLKR